MFEKLKQRWKVNGFNLILIITTFAAGGSLCGYAGRKLLSLTNLDKDAIWIFIYILLVTILWPIAVLLVSIPLGQFGFFKRYIGKIFKRFGSKKANQLNNTAPAVKTHLAIFASGAGSNAQQIINYFNGSTSTSIAVIICNKPNAGVLEIAQKAGIPSIIIEKERFFKGDHYLPELKALHIDYIILAGFLWKIPVELIAAYPKKIINIHPALLPGYGGKGMYGHYVHEAVIANKEKQSGITIHYVDELYDHGAIIFQATCNIDEDDNSETLAKKVHALEHLHFPTVIAGIVQK
jgi:formyltetrahydrofolate-dependent phosphoribosylglycinamide formyltransferase